MVLLATKPWSLCMLKPLGEGQFWIQAALSSALQGPFIPVKLSGRPRALNTTRRTPRVLSFDIFNNRALLGVILFCKTYPHMRQASSRASPKAHFATTNYVWKITAIIVVRAIGPIVLTWLSIITPHKGLMAGHYAHNLGLCTRFRRA